MYQYSNGSHSLLIHAKGPATNNTSQLGWGDFVEVNFKIDYNRPEPKVEVWDNTYGTVKRNGTNFVSSSLVQVRISDYGVATNYIMNETMDTYPNPADVSNILNPGTETLTNYIITNTSVDGLKKLYIWLKSQT